MSWLKWPECEFKFGSVTEYYMNMSHKINNDYGGYHDALSIRFCSLVVERLPLKR